MVRDVSRKFDPHVFSHAGSIFRITILFRYFLGNFVCKWHIFDDISNEKYRKNTGFSTSITQKGQEISSKKKQKSFIKTWKKHEISLILPHFIGIVSEQIVNYIPHRGHLVIWSFGQNEKWTPYSAHYSILLKIIYYSADFHPTRNRFWQMTKWPSWPLFTGVNK